jgi:HK97 family phage major capsid protein
MNSGCLVSVAKESGQSADTIVTENIINMYSRRFAAQTSNYAWYYNQNIEPQLFTMSLAVGTAGYPVFMPPGGVSQRPYSTILGLPAYAIEQCSALGDKGDIILANFRDGYITAEKGGLQQDMSIHVRFIYDESVLRFVLRFDGQPWRATALTPYKGGSGATQSHFITLDERA